MVGGGNQLYMYSMAWSLSAGVCVCVCVCTKADGGGGYYLSWILKYKGCYWTFLGFTAGQKWNQSFGSAVKQTVSSTRWQDFNSTKKEWRKGGVCDEKESRARPVKTTPEWQKGFTAISQTGGSQVEYVKNRINSKPHLPINKQTIKDWIDNSQHKYKGR